LIASIKAFFSLIGLLDTIAGWIEMAQMKAAIRAGDANANYEALAAQIRADRDLVFKIRSDPTLRARLRRRYTEKRPLPD